MGTTIRREPVSFAIPKAPDYKFLNITNFGGIEKSSNPFVVSSNTASDCLNVYVDEDNALTTRPRVSIKHDIKKALSFMGDFEIIAVYPLHTGYLVHLRTDRPILALMSEIDGGIYIKHTLSGSNKVPLEKMLVFEQNNKIYLMGSGKYFYVDWDGDEILEVEPYIPTTRIGKNKRVSTIKDDSTGTLSYEIDTAGTAYESLNLLTDKYKETYFWDETSEFQYSSDAIAVENQRYRWSSYSLDIEGQIMIVYDDGSFLFRPADLTTHPNALYCKPDDSSVLRMYDTGLSVAALTVFDVAGNSPQLSKNKTVICRGDEWTTIDIYVLSDDYTFKKKQTITGNDDIWYASISSTSGHIFITTSRTQSHLHYLYEYDIEENYLLGGYQLSFEGDDTEDAKYYTITVAEGSTDGSKIVVVLDDNTLNGNDINRVYELDRSNGGAILRRIKPGVDIIGYSLKLSPDGRFLLIGTTYGEIVDFKTNTSGLLDVQTPLYEKNEWYDMQHSHPYVTNDAVYWIGSSDNTLWSAKLDDSVGANGILKPINLHTAHTKTVSSWKPIADISDSRITLTNGEYASISQDMEAFMTVTKKLHIADDISKVADLSSKLYDSTLVCRFDNNQWFASGNYTFHTEYNNPSYIPLSSYNTLGEDYEEITGLSIVNDNILAAYKRKKIYIITPVTVGDQLTYSYTETKNVIGNDAVGAPILTILTEMPTIVSYDGIYALNQLENVQSGDRITTLISEAINPKWLKESKVDIDKCMTLNRLYWTYYILPHEKISGENKSYTKIYLLDNRSQQWYYWELPLLCINAFVKDNKTHLVDGNGKIFTLETTDLEGANPSETEYYDLVDPKARVPKLLIPWHWYSQILSLNTMNYTKRLVDTTFIMTDTDTQDGYRLQYRLKAWRKSVSETENGSEITGNVHYVQSTTKRTAIPRFSFIQFKLDNYEDDLQNNKLRLVGLGLKYVLLEGLY